MTINVYVPIIYSAPMHTSLLTMQQRFERFHEANPAIYKHFKQFAEQIRPTQRRLSASLIMERVRWEALTGQFVANQFTLENFKVNNNYTALYARKLMEEDPRFRGCFETRKRTTV